MYQCKVQEHLRSCTIQLQLISQHRAAAQGQGRREHWQEAHAELTCLLYPAPCLCNSPLLQQTKPKGTQPAERKARVISTPFTPHRQGAACDWEFAQNNRRWMKVTYCVIVLLLEASSLEISDVMTMDWDLGKEGPLLYWRNSGLLPVIPGGPPLPTRAYKQSLAHIQRDLHLWEKNYLHLFRFIYIHS